MANESKQKDVDDPSRPPPHQWRLRFNLLSLLLLTATIASWTSYWRTVRQTQQMTAQLQSLREIGRVLIIADPSQYAAVRKHATWNDDYRWQVYLPPEQAYEIRLATNKIAYPGNTTTALPAPSASALLTAGRHDIQLTLDKIDEQWRIAAVVDGHALLTELRPITWNPQQGSAGGSAIASSRQAAAQQPLVLFRQQFSVADPNGVSALNLNDRVNGLQLWIEPVPTGQESPSDQSPPSNP